MSRRFRRTLIALIAAASMSLLGLTAAAPVQAATSGPWNDCLPGNVCLYNGPPSQGFPAYQTPGIVPDGRTALYVVNNGHADGQTDHVYLQYRPAGSGGGWTNACLHYLPGGGYMLDKGRVEIRYMYWGGEC
ncbi:hypothetical protein [Glycomyces sp. NRRL B-16210]|uniref:hypothetical protein n=1 Tax=Glycomyces sp. NRRL B-16210 TaxID=1463821 RepID=UPI0004C04B19|nr:hypothetical protein [Glycomyces sp. NRRL B-16210]